MLSSSVGIRSSQLAPMGIRFFASKAPKLVLTLNCGSSSIKYQLLDMNSEDCKVKGLIDSIGTENCKLRFDAESPNERVEKIPNMSYEDAMTSVIEDIKSKPEVMEEGITGVGHRVVHGGPKLTQPTLVTPEVLQEIKNCIKLAPLHNPANAEGIEIAGKILGSEVPHVACFDTAFHSTIPEYASTYAIPYDISKELKLKKYGFHGISHQYVSLKAAQDLHLDPARSNFIVAHLGSGCSATAVHNGKSVDTTMGMTPMDGLVMGTRAGNLDPGVEQYLCEQLNLSIEEVTNILNKQSGLLGVSGISNDMRVLIETSEDESVDPEKRRRAKLAIDMFVYRLSRYIASLMISTGSRLDALVFTGGIGENSSYIRSRVMQSLKFMRFFENPKFNADNGASSGGIITDVDSPTTGMVIQTNEELQIAREVLQVLKAVSKEN
ncbi:Acetate kinase, putative [Perkinsus marinus ATCC 50983]|uniref:Probable acetate kinase n=1 Tax=Perkinsus marinus (strain ATCC 50983 / TXsc) TaxID=423536 RepID=C5L028_PERM5|nr:Acetate kinase, putative [Perkinsus marinus ATCC 50983]EER09886.1 Acetate kinase, putative [Perkinsus marinus ATCC 50983]|eukprot:XP_002778091.1 Acetate kinase, putative [Perkinsus marinus ATCC 50983]